MCSFYALFVYVLCIRSFYVLFLYVLFMRSLYSLFLCALSMRSFYALFLCTLFMRCLYLLFVFALFMCFSMRSLYSPFYALFSCAIFMSSFHKRLAILRMHKKYYCTQTNMAHDKMGNIPKKLGLPDHRARFVEEKISTDIVIYLWKSFINLA